MSASVTEQDILPNYPGYALGSVITKEDFHLPILRQKFTILESVITNLFKKKEEEIASAKYSSSSAGDQQDILIKYSLEIQEKSNLLKTISDNIFSMSKSQEILQVNEMLPIDFSRTKIRIQARSYPLERMEQLIIEKKVGLKVKDRIENFVSLLKFKEGPSPDVSLSTIEQVALSIENMLENDVQIRLIGSFISLSRVKNLDPITLREHSLISEKMKENISNYYVLAEAILGGFFLGYGQQISSSDTSGSSEATEKITFFSCISQGAIPKFEQLNLWGAYKSWKTSLLDDPDSGYPIGFKVRMLSDVLRENDII